MNKSSCPCGSLLAFEGCCGKYINDSENAPTALALMKSRYSAYATLQVDYLWNTTHPNQRQYYSKEEMQLWAAANKWQKLEIISSTNDTVEFKAYFLNKNRQNQIHHEFSNFIFEKSKWFYVDGKFQ